MNKLSKTVKVTKNFERKSNPIKNQIIFVVKLFMLIYLDEN